MAAHTRVLNATTGQRIKRSQARGRVDQCLSVWVEEGYSIRDLSLPEIVKARAEQARAAERIAPVEVGGCRFVLPYKTPAQRESAYILRATRGLRGNQVCWIDPAAKYAESCA